MAVLRTPDTVFSRLLGGAYGCSHRVASREMGLIGQDAFIVLDEAHISEANIGVLDFVAKRYSLNKAVLVDDYVGDVTPGR